MSSSRLDLTNLPLVAIPTSVPVAPVTGPSTSTDTSTGAVPAKRVNLFANSGYDGTTEATTDNGQTLALPGLSEDEQQQVNSLFGNLDPAAQTQLSAASRKLAQALYAQAGYNPAATQISAAQTQVAGNVTAASAGALQSTQAKASSSVAAAGASAGAVQATSQSSQLSTGSGDASSVLQNAFEQALKQQSSAPNIAANDADDDDDDSDDSDSDDSNSWSGGLQSAIPSQQQLQQSTTLTSSAALQSQGVGSSSSALTSGTSPVNPTVSIATPAVTTNLNAAGAQYNAASGNQNYDKTVQAVSFMGMLGLQNELGDFANQVQTNVNQQNQTRTDLADVRQTIANWPANQDTQTFTWTDYDQLGNPTTHTNVSLNKDQATALQSDLGDQLTSQTDMNQQQQLQLQDMTQKYQESINTISNLLKYEHDTVKAIIQNIHT